MRKSFFVFSPMVLAGVYLLLNISNEAPSIDEENRLRETVSCAPVGTDLWSDKTGRFIGILPGWGNHAYRISTQSDSAQVYFNQGLTMYYSYHSREAIASFREAARFDSTNAMLFWAQALALGPSYNFGYAYKMRPTVPDIVGKMNRHAARATPKERDLIVAMNSRYNVNDTADVNRKALNMDYANALKPLVAKYPDDIDIKALYIDAVMLTHAWDFWNNDGTPKEWTPELVRYCEDILAKDPRHPGALHYYIHVTEASRNPQVALSSADSLIKLFPGIAHMVHMSSHEYERIGYYAKGVVANEKADESLVLYDSLAKGLFPMAHVPHYYSVEAYCAFSGAMYEKAKKKTMTARHSLAITKEDEYSQFLYMFPEIAMVRLGKWQDILSDTTTLKPEWTYAVALNHFAKGMAYAKTGNLAEAEKHLAQLREQKKDKILEIKPQPIPNTPLQSVIIAENILLGNIRFQQKRNKEAIDAIQAAIRAEDELIYSEPKDWMLPARQYLGAFLFHLKKYAEAETVYREDLVWNPGNGWSLVGLYNALKAQGKTKELSTIKKQFMYSFSEAEQVPQTSAY